VKTVPDLIVKSNLNNEYNKEIIDKLILIRNKRRERDLSSKEEKVIVDDSKKIKVTEKIEVNEDGEGDGADSDELLFDKFINAKGASFPYDIDNEKSYLIFIPKLKDDRYLDTIRTILREVYRKLSNKGKPSSEILNKKYKLEEAQTEGYIIVIDEKEAEYNISFQSRGRITNASAIKNKDPDTLLTKIKEMITDDLGFMLIHISKENIDKFKEKINNEPGWEPEIIIFEPQISKKRTIIDEFELIKSENYREIEKTDPKISKKRLASLFWGFVEPKKEEKWKKGKFFDDYFAVCEKEFDKRLKKILEQGSVIINGQKRILLYESKLRFHPNARKLHQRIKVLVLKHLIEREGKDLEREI
ncbi:hypothetical protein LCGC14_3027190, partial [marine sediment metagenome]